MNNDINGDEAMKNLDDLTDKLFRKTDDDAEIIEDEPDEYSDEQTADD